MSGNALFIVEGARAEPRFLKQMWRLYLGEDAHVYSYNTNIHTLIKALFNEGDELDEDIDILQFLRLNEEDAEGKKLLSKKYTDKFLVFDMDPHVSQANEYRLKTLMQFFNDSTNNGKLYLNYPMLESYKDMKSLNDSEFKYKMAELSKLTHYKGIVNTTCCEELKSISNLDRDTFISLALIHLKKANHILNDDFDIPSRDRYFQWNGTEILDRQYESIRETGSVHVLNTSLFNMVDYRPNDFLIE
jgi:hypothetical protein